MSLDSPFPLDKCTDSDLYSFCECVWNLQRCDACKAGQEHVKHEPSCSWSRPPGRPERFFAYYRAITSSYIPELLPGDTPALRTHENLQTLVRALKDNITTPRGVFTQRHFGDTNDFSTLQPPLTDQNRAVDLAVRAMMMINCAADQQSLGLLESGVAPLTWRYDESLLEFFNRVFPQSIYPLLDTKSEDGRTPGITALLTATKLKSIAKLNIEPTNDIRDHLRLDQNTGTLLVYHHVGFLIECLNASYAVQPSADLEEEMKSGNIPRQLALETLDSLQKILFPADMVSRQLLRTLVAKASFDQACLQIHSDSYRRPGEHEIGYRYLSSRLINLYEAILNPRPRGILEKWAERRSGARYVMIATLIGVIIAVIIGLLGLIVAVFQAWVAYQAWKHPVCTSD